MSTTVPYAGNDEDARVVLHFDLDAFYVACERELNPQLRGVPVAVSQYNPYGDLLERAAQDIEERWVVNPQRHKEESKQSSSAPVLHDNDTSASNSSHSKQDAASSQQPSSPQKLPPPANEDTNGSLIAVSYEARACGVKRNQRGQEACKLCSQLNIVQVPVKHGKADLTMYRNASKRVMEVLRDALWKLAEDNEMPGRKNTQQQKDILLVEVASIDEVYVDVTNMANHLVNRIRNDEETFWKSIKESACSCTTIGGIEVLSEAAQATNSLGKDEIRRGSHVQVLDSNVKIDTGSQEWWNRDVTSFSNVQLRLACGAHLAAKARALVQATFDGGVFTLSAGVSSNKTLAKLSSGLKKPNRQTLVYRDPGVLQKLFHPLPLGRIRGLGGKFGTLISNLLGVETVGQLAEIPLSRLQYLLSRSDNSKSAQFLFDISRGLCLEKVTPRSKPKSIECSKTFPGPLAICVRESAKLEKWISELCLEAQERLQQDKEENSRYASTMRVSVQFNTQKSFLSKQTRSPRLDKYPKVAMDLVQSLIQGEKQKVLGQSSSLKDLKITGLGVGGSQFVDVAAGSASILSALQNASQRSSPSQNKSSSTNRRTRFLQRPEKQRKLSNLELWLQGASKGPPKSGQNTTTDAKEIDRKPPPASSGPSQQYTQTSRNPTQSSVNSVVQSKNSASSFSAMPNSRDEIDPEVLRALPKDLQLAVLGDLRQQKMQKKEQEKPRHNLFEMPK